jgi:DNA-binding IclR family transcriptional regulator
VIGISGPASRITDHSIGPFAEQLTKAAGRLSQELLDAFQPSKNGASH